MKRQHLAICLALFVLVAAGGWAYLKEATTGESMSASAGKYLATLSKEQQEQSTMAYDSEKRVDWHFIPKDHRKGLQIRDMNKAQRKAALALLESCLSKVGYDKSVTIMELESVLKELEKDKKGGNIRDNLRYYYTVFGDPAGDGRWGLSIEGHHLSLNFVVEGDKVVSSTPTFFAANPAEVMADYGGGHGIKKGTRVLADEELLAFKLVNSLSDKQRESAILAAKAPREIRAAGEPQPPTDAAEGIAVPMLEDAQKNTLRKLVEAYADNVPEDVRKQRLGAIHKAGTENIHFAWAGPTKPGIGHYYRIQGPTFLIEFVNTQPDAAGNPANHIHCVWRDMNGDFGLPISKK